MQLSGPTSAPLTQKEAGPAICALTRPPSDSDVSYGLRITALQHLNLEKEHFKWYSK